MRRKLGALAARRPGQRPGQRLAVGIAAEALDRHDFGQRRSGGEFAVGGARQLAGAPDLAQHLAQRRLFGRSEPEGAGDLARAERARIVAQESTIQRARRGQAASRQLVAIAPVQSAARGAARWRSLAWPRPAVLARLRALALRFAARAAAGASCAAAALRRPSRLALGALRREQRDRRVQGEAVGVGALRQRGDDAVMADIGPVAAAIERDRRRPRDGGRARAAIAARAAPPVLASASSVTARLRPMVSTSSSAPSEVNDLAVLDIGAEAADPGDDRLAGLGMAADLARQRQQPAAPSRDRRRRACSPWAARPASACRRSRLRRAGRNGRRGPSCSVTLWPLAGIAAEHRVGAAGLALGSRPRAARV